MTFSIGKYEINPSLNRVSGPDEKLQIEPRVMSVLEVLFERAGEVVSTNELIRSAWNGTAVSDDAVTRCISVLRRVLGDDRERQAVIQTIPKKGYRLVPAAVSAPEPQATTEETRSQVTLDRILANCTDPVFGFDREGRYLFASEAGARAIGRTPAEMVGKCWKELAMPAEIMEPFHREVASVFAGEGTVKKTVCYPTIYGLRCYEYVLDPVVDAEGEIFAVLAVVRRVDDREADPSARNGS